MFITVICAHLLAVLFSFCGIVQLCAQLGGPRPESAGAFAAGLLASCWPLAVAGIIELLVQIAGMLETLLLQKSGVSDIGESSTKSPFRPVVKKQEEPVSAAGRFFRADPVPEAPVAEDPLNDTEEVSETVKNEEAAPEEKKEPERKERTLNFFRVD